MNTPMDSRDFHHGYEIDQVYALTRLEKIFKEGARLVNDARNIDGAGVIEITDEMRVSAALRAYRDAVRALAECRDDIIREFCSDPDFHLSQRQIARDAGISTTTVRAAIAKPEAAWPDYVDEVDSRAPAVDVSSIPVPISLPTDPTTGP